MRSAPRFLQTLLTADPSSPEFLKAAEQLESQPELQPVLEEIALGDDTWWQEARAILSESGGSAPMLVPQESTASQKNTGANSPVCLNESSILIEIESTLDGDAAVECEQVTLDFLAEASHPELLGRLGRYDIERVIGTGGMGVVLRGFDSELHRVVAIKVLAPHLAHNASARRRFAREARAAAAVVHPHVIPIFNVDSDATVPHLVMQYVAGQSLQRRVDSGGPLPVPDTLRIAQQTAAGLAAAHAQGLVHRDVKPANILLEEQLDVVRLSDFGLARAVDDASLTKTGIVAGTPYYMSPEQAFGAAIDHRSDLFSLGSVIYFMLTGHPPFRASGAMAVLHRICTTPHRPLEQVNYEVPVELARLVDRLLEKEPDKRFETASEVGQQLGLLLAAFQQGRLSICTSKQGKTASSESSVTRLAYATFRKAMLAGVCAIVALLAAGALLPDRFLTSPIFVAVEADPPREAVEQTTSAPGTAISADATRTQLRSVLTALVRQWQAELHAEQAFHLQLQAVAQEIRAANEQPVLQVQEDTFEQQVRSMQSMMNRLQQEF